MVIFGERQGRITCGDTYFMNKLEIGNVIVGGGGIEGEGEAAF